MVSHPHGLTLEAVWATLGTFYLLILHREHGLFFFVEESCDTVLDREL